MFFLAAGTGSSGCVARSCLYWYRAWCWGCFGQCGAICTTGTNIVVSACAGAGIACHAGSGGTTLYSSTTPNADSASHGVGAHVGAGLHSHSHSLRREIDSSLGSRLPHSHDGSGQWMRRSSALRKLVSSCPRNKHRRRFHCDLHYCARVWCTICVVQVHHMYCT